jgi:hypothetical protein
MISLSRFFFNECRDWAISPAGLERALYFLTVSDGPSNLEEKISGKPWFKIER